MSIDISEPFSTINPDSDAFFEGLAHTWWDRTGPFWPLHRLNNLRAGWLRDQICAHYGIDGSACRPLAGLRVLDIGCGGGILSVAMAGMGARVHGIDVVERNIRTANQFLSGMPSESPANIRFETTSAETLVAARSRYDIVMSMEVVEHVNDLPSFIASNCALVADGGALFVSTINRTLCAWLFAIVGAEYVLRWLPRGTHQWSRFVKPSELRSLLTQQEFSIRSQAGVAVNPLTRSFRLTSNPAVNYMAMAAREV